MKASLPKPLRRLAILASVVGLLVLANACSGPGGRRYPIIGFGWVTVPTNQPTTDSAIDIRGAVVNGLLVGTAGPWTGVVIGRAESLSVAASTNGSGWAEGSLSDEGFRFRVVPFPKNHENPTP